jgi:hypothetical protein
MIVVLPVLEVAEPETASEGVTWDSESYSWSSSSYRAVNIHCIGYKNQSVNAV